MNFLAENQPRNNCRIWNTGTLSHSCPSYSRIAIMVSCLILTHWASGKIGVMVRGVAVSSAGERLRAR